MTNYRLKTSPPSMVDLQPIYPDLVVADQMVVFQTTDNKYHAITQLWHGSSLFYHHNLSDHTVAAISNPLDGNAARWCLDKTNNVIYFGSGYGAGLFYKYNITTGVVLQIVDAPGWPSYAQFCMVDAAAGLIWLVATGSPGYHGVGTYDPVTDTVDSSWPVTPADSDSMYSFGFDANYLYYSMKGKNGTTGYFLCIYDRSTKALVSTTDKDVSNPDSHVFIGSDGFMYYITKASGSDKYYKLPNVVDEVASPAVPHIDPRLNCAYDNLNNVAGWYNNQPYPFNFLVDNLLPKQVIQEYSELGYRTPMGSGAYTYSRPTYTGPWVSSAPIAIALGTASGKIIGTKDNTVAAMVEFDYKSNTIIPQGYGISSNYGAVILPSGLVYILGYPKTIYQWDIAREWALTRSVDTPKLYNESTLNPFQLTHVDIGHYPFRGDYDANGLLWTASNYKSPTTGGQVAYYNPADGTNGVVTDLRTIFAAGVNVRDLICTNARTKICVTASDGNLYVVNIASPTAIEHTWPLTTVGIDDYKMVEVSPGVILIIQGSATDTTGNVSRISLMTANTGSMIYDKVIGVTGQLFGFGGNSAARYKWQLTKGPDGMVYMFVGDNLYQIDPATGNFTQVSIPGVSTYKQMIANGTDLVFFGSQANIQYVPDLWEEYGNPRTTVRVGARQYGV